VALALVAGGMPRRPLLRWLLRWRQLRAPVSAAELIAAGWRPGPELGAELRRLRSQRLAQERC
jgi:poly(A) polymerase